MGTMTVTEDVLEGWKAARHRDWPREEGGADGHMGGIVGGVAASTCRALDDEQVAVISVLDLNDSQVVLLPVLY